MKEIPGKLVAGVVGIGLITAFALHASGLATLGTQGFRSAGLVEKTAIHG